MEELVLQQAKNVQNVLFLYNGVAADSHFINNSNDVVLAAKLYVELQFFVWTAKFVSF